MIETLHQLLQARGNCSLSPEMGWERLVCYLWRGDI